MGRPLRIERAGGWCPITGRGNERKAIFRDKGKSWLEFRDQHGDRGRDLVLYVGQRLRGMKLRELAAATGMTEYSAASIAIRRFGRRLERSGIEREQFKQLCQLLNVAM